MFNSLSHMAGRLLSGGGNCMGWYEAPHLDRRRSEKQSQPALSPRSGSPTSYCPKAKNMPSSDSGDILSGAPTQTHSVEWPCLSPLLLHASHPALEQPYSYAGKGEDGQALFPPKYCTHRPAFLCLGSGTASGHLYLRKGHLLTLQDGHVLQHRL